MQQLGNTRVRRRMGRVLGRAAAVLLFAAALRQSGIAYAGPHGGGGGFHGRGEFHGGGFGRVHGGGFGELGWTYYPYPYGWDSYPDYGYDSGQPSTSQTKYCCSDPAGCTRT
jgi:hypothetical protein